MVISEGEPSNGPRLLRSLLPSDVAAAEAFGDLDEPLYPEESVFLARAVDKRRREFSTVRGCARTALAQLEMARPPMVPGRDRAPSWPDGVVGSMTHCHGYAAAAVGRADGIRGLGVDAEPHAPLPPDVVRLVTRPGECRDLAGWRRDCPTVCWDRLLFSAKESVYKAWYPIARRWLGFSDVRITVDIAAGTFGVELNPGARPGSDLPASRLTGRWTVSHGLVVTAVTVPITMDCAAWCTS